MRTKDFYCIVDCGDGGQNGHSGHAHNDSLSFELNVGGEDFIVDPGTYVYTSDPEARKCFRGTAMHNTVKIDGEEQNRPRSYTIFSMHNDAISQINRWDTDESRDILDAEHFGYKRLKNPVIHGRKFEFDKKKRTLEITDTFKGKGEHELEWNFHFAPGVTVSPVILGSSNNGEIKLSNHDKEITLTLPPALAKQAVIQEDFVSPSYGMKKKAMMLTIIYSKFVMRQEIAASFSIKTH